MILVHIWWGITSVTNWFYGITSGWLGDVTIVGSFFTWWKLHECHVDKCHKHAKYPIGHYKVCHKHHPAVPAKVTHLHIKQLHKKEDKHELAKI